MRRSGCAFGAVLGVSLILSFTGAAHVSAQAAVDQRSAFAAAMLEWFTLPTIGYAYAGNWDRGIPPALARVAGFALFLSDANVVDTEESCGPRCALGVGLFVGASAWAIIDVINTTHRENERRASAVRVSALPALGHDRVGVELRIAVPY